MLLLATSRLEPILTMGLATLYPVQVAWCSLRATMTQRRRFTMQMHVTSFPAVGMRPQTTTTHRCPHCWWRVACTEAVVLWSNPMVVSSHLPATLVIQRTTVSSLPAQAAWKKVPAITMRPPHWPSHVFIPKMPMVWTIWIATVTV